MSDDQAQQLQEALDRTEATHLGVYQGKDISELIRRLLTRQSEVQRQLHAVVAELDQVAALLRQQEDQPTSQAIDARNHIATDFAQGARVVEQTRETLIKTTKELEYLRYRLL